MWLALSGTCVAPRHRHGLSLDCFRFPLCFLALGTTGWPSTKWGPNNALKHAGRYGKAEIIVTNTSYALPQRPRKHRPDALATLMAGSLPANKDAALFRNLVSMPGLLHTFDMVAMLPKNWNLNPSAGASSQSHHHCHHHPRLLPHPRRPSTMHRASTTVS